MKELKLDDLLRYGLTGVLALLASVALCPTGMFLPKPISSLADATVMGALALAWGSLIYAFHRAVTYPVLYRFVMIPHLWRCGRRWSILLFWGVLKPELDRDLQRWKDRSAARAALREWGTQVHFLYCSALAIISALWLTSLLCSCRNEAIGRLLRYVALGSFGAGFLHNMRLTSVESDLPQG